jgi:biotin transport system substrate-specific component
MMGGIVVLYAFGIVYLAFAAQIGLKAAFTGSMAFIPGDVIKAFVAALVGRAVMAGYPLLPVKG